MELVNIDAGQVQRLINCSRGVWRFGDCCTKEPPGELSARPFSYHWGPMKLTLPLLGLYAVGAGALASEPLAVDGAPHILVVVADDLGWNDVSWHGSSQVPIPNLQGLADEGLVLDNYYVQPVCSPTRSTILTGRHVIHTGIYDPDCGPGNTNSVPLNITMLPEHLSSVGYESHAVGKWHLGMFSRSAIPTGKGFNSFYGYYSGAEDYYTHVSNGANDFHRDRGSNLTIPDVVGQYSTFLYADKAVKVIENFADQHLGPDNVDDDTRLFMYLAFQAIHSPTEVPTEYSDRFNETIPDTPDHVGQQRRIVAGMIACMDEAVGNVTAALKNAGMIDNTLILFTTDNGGPAQGFNNNMASNWPLRGMKRTLWQGGVRGAGFIRGPGIRAAGEVRSLREPMALWSHE